MRRMSDAWICFMVIPIWDFVSLKAYVEFHFSELAKYSTWDLPLHDNLLPEHEH